MSYRIFQVFNSGRVENSESTEKLLPNGVKETSSAITSDQKENLFPTDFKPRE